MKHAVFRILTLIGAVLFAGCGLLPQPPVPPALHDFGPVAVTQSVPMQAPQISAESVSAPPWLADTGIHYRLMYDDSTRLRVYAENRWIAPPAQLIQQRLRLAFSNTSVSNLPAAGEPHYQLQVQLLDFEQTFGTPQSAMVNLRAVASLRSAAGGPVLAQHLFTVSVGASPDVQGAVQGYSLAAGQLLGEIVQWAESSVAAASKLPANS